MLNFEGLQRERLFSLKRTTRVHQHFWNNVVWMDEVVWRCSLVQLPSHNPDLNPTDLLWWDLMHACKSQCTKAIV